MSADSGPGQREVAYRMFAAEFDDATLSYSESDEERAPNYVVTPTGLRVNRLFAVGVLTEVEAVNDDVTRGRVVDPTGAFVTYAGQYQPDAYGFLESSTPPTFLAMTGKARTFEPEDSDRIYTSVRPESLNEVDAGTRDRWTVSTAEATLRRVAVFAGALERDERGDDLREVLRSAGVGDALAAGIPRAIDHYGTTTAYLEAVRRLAVEALEVVADERDEVQALTLSPGEGGSADLGPLPSVDAAEELAAVAGDVTAGATADDSGPVETETETGGEAEAETAEAEAETGATAEASESESKERVEPETEPEEPAETEATETEPQPTTEESSDVAETASADVEADSGSDEDEADDLGDFAPGGESETPVSESTDEMYELDEEEVREVEEEFGTDFSTGTEVPDAGEADIDVPDADELAEEAGDAGAGAAEPTESDAADSTGDVTPESAADEAEPVPSASETESSESAADAEPESEPESAEAESEAESADEADTTEEPPEDLPSAAVDVMEDLGDDEAVEREAVVDEMVSRFEISEEAAEDAIQDALMSGLCYEPGETTLRAI